MALERQICAALLWLAGEMLGAASKLTKSYPKGSKLDATNISIELVKTVRPSPSNCFGKETEHLGCGVRPLEIPEGFNVLSFPTSPPTRREPTASDTCPLSGMLTRHSPEDSSTCRQAVEEAPLRR
ncbi:hypothetical protein V8C44DRAFT_233775 [Trichoderma aethiopicum]